MGPGSRLCGVRISGTDSVVSGDSGNGGRAGLGGVDGLAGVEEATLADLAVDL